MKLFILLTAIVVGLMYFKVSIEKYIRNKLYLVIINIMSSLFAFLLILINIVFIVPNIQRLSFYKTYVRPESNADYMITFCALVLIIASLIAVTTDIKKLIYYKKR